MACCRVPPTSGSKWYVWRRAVGNWSYTWELEGDNKSQAALAEEDGHPSPRAYYEMGRSVPRFALRVSTFRGDAGLSLRASWFNTGVRLRDLPTPSVLVDRTRLLDNINAMQAAASAAGLRLRPHAKTRETGQTMIHVKPFPNIDDGQWRVSSEQGLHPTWSPDGQELFYRGVDRNLMVAQIETEPTFSTRTPEPLFSLSGYAIRGGRQFDLAPDGDRFIFLKSRTAAQTSAYDLFEGLIFVENWFEELTERVPVP